MFVIIVNVTQFMQLMLILLLKTLRWCTGASFCRADFNHSLITVVFVIVSAIVLCFQFHGLTILHYPLFKSRLKTLDSHCANFL